MISEAPNRISISGHTDATAYAVAGEYGNWELSADRANAARRELLAGGMAEDKIGRVVGLGSSDLLDPSQPEASINRRISIVVLRGDFGKSVAVDGAAIENETAAPASADAETAAESTPAADPTITVPEAAPPAAPTKTIKPRKHKS